MNRTASWRWSRRSCVITAMLDRMRGPPDPGAAPHASAGANRSAGRRHPHPRRISGSKSRQSGVLRVGTSADYPPFEYYNSRYQLDGFDIGLIREIGKQLGVQVEIKDYAFDGLYNALQLGSIDAAISAITVTARTATVRRLHEHLLRGQGRSPGRMRGLRSPSITKIEQLADKSSACKAARSTRSTCKIPWWRPS